MSRLVVVLAAALALAPTALASPPVPSLTPAATHALWLREVARHRVLSDAACRPARVLFYDQTDWLRVATTMAANPSACAQYYVSVPPLSADKTQARPKQAALIRALGPSFHALDEISWNGWNAWVGAGNGTWYDAGVLARQRMAAAGFDAAAGDTWALNELSSAVRGGTGAARQNALEFMRGLASDGVKGVVFTVGVSQTSDPTAYKANLQGWLSDDGFWSAAAQYASDWAQENYGDVRAYAVAGSTPQQRRDAMVQYLGHELTLANANPNVTAASRAFLDATFVAFGNAAWAWSSSYGFTAASLPVMEDFVSGQVYAARSLGAPSGVDRLGFAWSPQNSFGLSNSDYTNQTAAVLQRIAAAIHDSDVPADDPGAAACAPAWCTSAVDGAAFPTWWQQFSTWSTPALAFTNPPASLTAGGSVPLTVAVAVNGIAQISPTAQSVVLSTSSPQGGFSTSPSGPFTPTLTVTIAAGTSSTGVYYSDTAAATATVSAALPGQAAATQAVTVTAGPLAKLAVAPATAALVAGGSVMLSAAATDAYGNAVATPVSWATTAGALSTSTGPSVQFTAGPNAGTTVVTARAGAMLAKATITVTQPKPRVGSISTKSVDGHLVVTVKVLRGTKAAAGVALTLRVRKGSSAVALVQAKTNAHGLLVWRSRNPLPKGRYVASAAIRSASTASRTQHSSR